MSKKRLIPFLHLFLFGCFATFVYTNSFSFGFRLFLPRVPGFFNSVPPSKYIDSNPIKGRHPKRPITRFGDMSNVHRSWHAQLSAFQLTHWLPPVIRMIHLSTSPSRFYYRIRHWGFFDYVSVVLPNCPSNLCQYPLDVELGVFFPEWTSRGATREPLLAGPRKPDGIFITRRGGSLGSASSLG
jgi:hypothetical protein